MEFQKLVESRRSIRAYNENIVITKAEIEEIIKCSQEAPSWKHSQTARYYVAIDSDKVNSLREKALPEFNQNNSKNAAALIVTAFEANRSGFERDGNPTNEIGNEWGAYDLGLANMLLCLKAKELGYDTLIMGIRDNNVLREELSIPDSQHVVSVIAVGKSDKVVDKPVRKELEKILTIF